MHPILASGQRLALYLGFWCLVAALLSAAFVTASGAEPGEAVAIVFPLSIIYSFVCLSGWYVCRATPLETSSAGRVGVAQFGSAVLATLFWVISWEAWTRILAGSFPGSVGHYREQFVMVAASGFLLYGLATMFHYLLIAFEDSRQAETRELGLEVMAREAELKALRSQVDPHFLFNGLNSISALTATDPAGARRMCLLLAEFFRNSVRLGTEDRVPLREEIEMVSLFFDIERVRYGDRLSAEIEVTDGCGSCGVPPLLLQPLVENAVRHGINSLVEGGNISVRATCADSLLKLVVENPYDTGAPRSAKGAGVGLTNVRRRVRTIFGGSGAVDIHDDVHDDRGMFRVELRLPCEGRSR